jgi:hypothetical protein
MESWKGLGRKPSLPNPGPMPSFPEETEEDQKTLAGKPVSQPRFEQRIWRIRVYSFHYAKSLQVHNSFFMRYLSTLSVAKLYSVEWFFYSYSGGGVESRLGPVGTSATEWPIVPAPGDCDGQGKPKYSMRTCPRATLSTINLTCQTRARTRAAAVGSQRLTAWAMARPLASNYRWMMNWKGFEMKRSWPIRNTIPAGARRDWWNPQKRYIR